MPELKDPTLDNAAGNQDGQELDANGQPINAGQPPAIDWENEANPYRKRYGDSQNQVQPLVRTLQQFAEYDHQTKSWKPKSAAAQTVVQDDVEQTLSGYDPEFVKALGGYTQKQISAAIAKFKEEAATTQEYTTKMLDGRNKAMSEFGSEFDFAKDGLMNSASPLYQMANEIINKKYAIFNPDGTFSGKYSQPDAEYLATVEAYAILVKRAKQQPPQDKGKFAAIQGKGTKAAGINKPLSYEDYSKLSTVEQDAYDLSQSGGV